MTLLPPIAPIIPHPVPSPSGERVDNYYWLRDDTRSNPDVLNYLTAENHHTETCLAHLAAAEAALFKELTDRLPPNESSVPVLDKGYWYVSRFREGEQYPTYLRWRDGTTTEDVLLDLNDLARGHDFLELGHWDISPDGQWLAYSLDTQGRRQYTLHLKHLPSGVTTNEIVHNMEADLVWSGDSRRLIYLEKDPQTLLSVRVKVHTLGEPEANDRVLYEETDDSYYLGLSLSRSEAVILLSCASTEQTQWWHADVNDPWLRFRPFLARDDGHEYDIEHIDGHFLVRTNWHAPNFRLCITPFDGPQVPDNWIDIVPHRESDFIEDFEPGMHHLSINVRRQGNLVIDVFRLDAHFNPTPLCTLDAAPGACVHLIGTPDIHSPCVRHVRSSLRQPDEVYDLDVRTGRSEWRKTQEVRGNFRVDDYICERRWADARDGTRVPVTLAYHRNTPLDGTAPSYLYGYGAYGYAIDPDFDDSWVSLMDRGFVVAIAHVRGGQELGRSWYDSGRLANKQHTFTDFIDVRHMLVNQGVVAADRVCAQGGSAGGLLMGAVANMAPSAFRALVAYVPFVDVVTTMLDDSIPLTSNEYDQWGDPNDPQDYACMLAYSPYDNVKPQDYPAMMVFTGLWDSQVQYFEPAKWVARLRALKTDSHPLLFQTDMSAGHGGKSGRYDAYRDTAREYVFLLWQLGLLPGQPSAAV